MLILCSNGLSSDKLIKSVVEHFNGQKTAALVVTADNEYKENNYHVNRCIVELQSLGLSVDIFDIDVQDAKLLHNYDVVEFIGGNPFYLLNSIRKANAENILREIGETKVLIGWSAAAFVFGPSLELVNMYSPEMNFLALTDLKGISLTDVEILPHYNKFLNRFENFEEKCEEYEKRRNANVIRINDGDGIIVNCQEITIIRKEQA